MGTSEEGLEDGLRRALRDLPIGDVNELAQQLAKELAPTLGGVAKRLAPRYQVELWPQGPPAPVTWAAVMHAFMGRLDRLADVLIDLDLQAAASRATPARAEVSSIRPDTALRLQLNHQLKQRYAGVRMSFVDRLLDEPDAKDAGSATLVQRIDDTLWVLGEIADEAVKRTDPEEREDRARAITVGTLELALHLQCMAQALNGDDLVETMRTVAAVLERVVAETA